MNLSSSVQRMSRFVFENPDVVNSVDRIINYNDEPKIYQYISQITDGRSSKKIVNSTASGVSFDRDIAFMKLLGETVERYSLGVYDSKRLVQSSYTNLVGGSKRALNPSELSLFPQFLTKHKGKIGDVPFYWVAGKSLVTNRSVLVPAQLVFTPYLHSKLEPVLRMEISTGAAAGENVLDATYRGICEVIERDSFMIHYYNKISSPRIDPLAFMNAKIFRIVSALKRYNLELCVNDITTDLGVPAVVAIVIDRTNMGPAVCVGLKAGFDMEQNVIGATEEALMVRSWVRDEYIYSKYDRKLPKIISTIEDRASYWCPSDTIPHLDFWINAKIIPFHRKIRLSWQTTYKQKVDELVSTLRLKGFEVICVDITAPKVRKYGVRVVKMIIPGLQPLHLDEKFHYLSFPRMYSAPVNMGVFSKEKNANELNSIIHPFL